VVTLGTVVSRQGERWLDALTRAEGELVWLVPPTGTADRTLLATLAAGFDSERVDAALCRSRCGEAVFPAVPHRGTRAMLDDGEGLAGRLRREPELGADLAAVLWRRSALRAALERLRDAGVAADARSALAAIAEAGGRIAVFAAELSRRDSPPAPAAAPPPRRSPAAADTGAKNAAVRSAASASRAAPKKAAATKGPARRARRRPAAPEA
jgi:hypothetical protein